MIVAWFAYFLLLFFLLALRSIGGCSVSAIAFGSLSVSCTTDCSYPVFIILMWRACVFIYYYFFLLLRVFRVAGFERCQEGKELTAEEGSGTWGAFFIFH